MDDITELERDLLLRLCESKVTLSAVLVAAEWWESPGDPDYSMVVWLLEGLGERGLITYRLSGEHDHVPVYIRVTPRGYTEAGFPTHYAVDIGRAHRSFKGEHAMNARDYTDFRNHSENAPWAPVERMPIEEHLSVYPSHRLNKGRFFMSLTTPAGSTLPTEFKTIVNAAKRQGWGFEKTAAGHTILKHPDTGAVVSLPGTPGDHRAFKNARADLMRKGLILQGRRPVTMDSEAPTEKDPGMHTVKTPTVVSSTDGPLVNGKAAPMPYVKPINQNEKPLIAEPMKTPLLDDIRRRVLLRDSAVKAAKLMEEAAAMLTGIQRETLVSQAIDVLDASEVDKVEQEYYEYAKTHTKAV